ncbi:MAG TPA: IS21 family transposase [Polyangiales bacterium]|nr:IS21 family transposase [Polyangiales bacterium]
MVRRHEIQVLRRAGHSLAETAKLVGVSQSTVQRVEAESAVASFDTATERERRGVGRPSKAEPMRSFLIAELAKEPDVMALELLRRARQQGYAGGKSALYVLVKELRPQRPKTVVRFEGLPGEFSQHDFGHVDVRYLDGRRRRVHFFASRLKYSRWVQVSLVVDERVESLVRAMIEHFAAWGGLPLLAVFDRPKTVALSWSKDSRVIDWNPTFAAVALDLGLGVELCWPHSPEQKGSVENLVGWVKGSFFKQRRFLDDQDLAEQLLQWHDEVNTQRPSRATGVMPAVRLAEEQQRLRPLRIAPNALALRIPVHVGPTGYVLHETRTYSMPPEAIGIPGTLFLHRDRVRIVAGRYEATHDRLLEPKSTSTLPEHRAQRVAAVAGKRAKRYMKREHLLGLGGVALSYLTELVHRRPRIWVRDVDRMHELLEKHGDDAIRAALQRGLTDGVYGHEYIAHYLTAASTQQELPL